MPQASMKALVEYMAQSIVDQPQEVQVEEIVGARSMVYELRVASADMGRIIGKHGRVANAMRSLLHIASVRNGKRATLEIVE